MSGEAEEKTTKLQGEGRSPGGSGSAGAAEPPPELPVIYEKDDPRGRVQLFETADRCRAYLEVTAHTTENPYSVDDVLQIVSELKITAEVRTQEVASALSRMKAEGDSTGRLVLCEGVLPAAAAGSACEVLFNQADPCVVPGTLLLRIKEPAPGTEGKTIYGEVAEAPKASGAEIILGSHVARGPDGELISEVFGRAVFENNFLAVHPVIEIEVSEDAMEARLTCSGATRLTREQIVAELKAKKVVHGIDNQTIDSCVTVFNEKSGKVEGLVVARGSPARDGRSGQVRFSFETGKCPRFVEREDGSVNLRETHLVQSVKEGAELAELTPHDDPVPGMNILGRSIIPPEVETPVLIAGDNVRVSGDGLHFFAETGGRPALEGDTLSVCQALVVSGGLDMSVGNIDFDGEVEINGDVEDGYRVKAAKSIIVRGFVGTSNLEAGLDIMIGGGCNGQGKSVLISGRDIQSQYMDETNVRASGDVTVKNEIVNSVVRSLGRVRVEGRICGGEITAKKGIEACDLGSDAGVATILFPGKDFELAERCKRLDASIIEKHRELKRVSTMIEPLLNKRELLDHIEPEKRKKLEETLNYVDGLKEELESLTACKNDLVSERLADAVPEIIARRYVYQGVFLKIGEARREIASRLQGPLRLFEGEETVSVESCGGSDAQGGPEE